MVRHVRSFLALFLAALVGFSARGAMGRHEGRGVTFGNLVATYDGQPHMITVGNLPDGIEVATIAFENGAAPTDVGEYEATVTFRNTKPDLRDDVPPMTVTLKIGPASLTEATAVPQAYTGARLEPALVVKAGRIVLTEADYEVGDWSGGCLDMGTYAAVVAGKGNFTGTATANFRVSKRKYDMSGFVFADTSRVYDGEAHAITWGGTLPEGVGVTVTGAAGRNAGTYVFTATFTGDFGNHEPLAERTATLTITKAAYDLSGVTFADGTVTYDGLAHALEIDGDLPAGVTVSYAGNGRTEAGDWTVRARFAGDARNFEPIADRTAMLTISRARLTEATAPTATFDNTVKTPTVTAKAGALDATFEPGVWSGELLQAGTYTMMVTGTGNFCGAATASFTINEAENDSSSGNAPDAPGCRVNLSNEAAPQSVCETADVDAEGGAYVFGADTANAHVCVKNASVFELSDTYVLTAKELAKYTLNGTDGELIAEALLGEGGTYAGGTFALGLEGALLSVTLTGGTLTYAADTTVEIPGGILLGNDVTVSVASGATVTFSKTTPIDRNGHQIVRKGDGLVDFGGKRRREAGTEDEAPVEDVPLDAFGYDTPTCAQGAGTAEDHTK